MFAKSLSSTKERKVNKTIQVDVGSHSPGSVACSSIIRASGMCVLMCLFLFISARVLADDVIPTREDGVIVASYRFTMTHGSDQAVCRAFLKRLNTAKYSDPPYCGIPDDTSVAGFEPLTRDPLTQQATINLVPAIVEYMRNQIVWTPDMVISPRDQERFDTVERWARGGIISAWRYQPPVSIGNNGVEDNVLLWQEPGCGTAGSVGAESTQLIVRAPTFAFVLTQNNQSIDGVNTNAKFGDPLGLYQPKADGYVRSGHNGFHPIGRHMGIFKFRTKYFIHTFLDPEAVLDLSSKKVARITLGIANTLAVFARDHHATHRLCEYTMVQTPPEASPPGSTPN